jgi:hypothetical protein
LSINSDQITDEILSAFDQMAEEGAEEGGITEPAPGDEPTPDEPTPDDEVEVTAEAEEEDEPHVDPEPVHEEGDDETQEAEEEDPDAEEAERLEGELSPEVQAYVDRHGGDLDKALKTMVEAQTMLQRRNAEYQGAGAPGLSA